jgi:Flp pilus assembly protein TadG
VSSLLRRRTRRGQTLVEFALILPIFLLLVIGIFDFGRAVYAYNTISNAAREAVRTAIVDQNVSVITAEAVSRSATVGVTAADVTVEFRTSDLSALCVAPYAIGCVAVVTVGYDYTAATPVIGNLIGTISMSATTRQPIEYVFQTP